MPLDLLAGAGTKVGHRGEVVGWVVSETDLSSAGVGPLASLLSLSAAATNSRASPFALKLLERTRPAGSR